MIKPHILVLLRGLSREQRHWGSFLEELGYTSHFHVCCLDLPGTGEHWQVPCPSSLPEVVSFLRSDFQKKQREKKLPSEGIKTIIALSFGGMIALDWLHRYPKDFDKLVLMNTSCRSLSPVWERISIKQLPQLVSIFATSNVRTREKKILSLVSNHHHNSDDVLETWVAIQQDKPVSKKTVLKQVFMASNFTIGPLVSLKKPVCILFSRKDRLVPCQASLALADYFKIHATENSTAGHDLPLDAPSWTAQRVTEFLKNH